MAFSHLFVWAPKCYDASIITLILFIIQFIFILALISVAQVLYLLGVTGMIVCTATAFILGFRRYTSPPGEMCLAGATTSIGKTL